MSDPSIPVAVPHYPIGLQLLLFPRVHKTEFTISVARIEKCLRAPALCSGEITQQRNERFIVVVMSTARLTLLVITGSNCLLVHGDPNMTVMLLR